MWITVIDDRSAYAQLAKASGRGRNRVLVKVAPSLPLPAVVASIRQAAGNGRRIRLLRILAHGNSAYLALGADVLGILTAACFKYLRPCFAPDAIGIALHSCGPASATPITRDTLTNRVVDRVTGRPPSEVCVPGTLAVGGGPGLDFVRRLATVTQVPVRAALGCQRNDLHWRFEGDSVVVRPNGSWIAVPGWGRLAADHLRIVRQEEVAAP